MERQRSFTMKPSRFSVFSLTVSFSVVVLTFFSIWVFKNASFARLENSVQFKDPSAGFGVGPEGYLSRFGQSGGRDLVSDGTETTKRPENFSGFLGISVINGVQRNEREDGVTMENGYGVSSSSDLAAVVTSEAEAPETVVGEEEEEEEEEEKAALKKGGGPDTGESEEDTEETLGKEAEGPESGKSEEKKIEETSEKEVEVADIERIEKKQQVRAASFEKSELSGGGMIRTGGEDCDLKKGKWVFDESYPIYRNDLCPFIDEGFDCEGNGRLDKDYMKWRWQPQDCDIQRFNATKMLELIRGKRLVFVGDSINRNQWESMLCMLFGAIRDQKRVYEARGRKITKEKGNYCFRFVDYRCTVEYYVSHFLVHEGKARVGQKRVQTLRIDAIDHGSSKWRGADILVFNTAHWWTHHKTKAGVNYYQEGDLVHPRLDVATAFRRALTTWASWVDRRINRRKTRVFFRSSAPSHFRGGQWNSGGHCGEVTRPLNESSGTDYTERNSIVEEVIRQMKTPVTFLDISGLSDYRVDGHPSKYGKKPGRSRSSRIQDCSHWCLPGVPDSWNELLYHHLMHGDRTKGVSG